MKLALNKFLVLTAAGLSLASCSTSFKTVDIGASRKIYNLKYGEHPRNVMDVFLPEEKNPATPLVMIVHGGAWMFGQKEHMWNVRNYLFKNHIPTASINYRLLKKNITYREQLEDIGKAVQFAKENAPGWNLHNQGIILLGESAGGHLALLYGYQHPEEIKKIISMSGPTDFYSDVYRKTTYYRLSKGTFQKVVGAKYSDTGSDEKFKAASPLANISDVPTLIFQGNTDLLVNQSQGKALDSALTARGFRHEFVYMKGSGHVPRLFNPKVRNGLVFPSILKFIREK